MIECPETSEAGTLVGRSEVHKMRDLNAHCQVREGTLSRLCGMAGFTARVSQLVYTECHNTLERDSPHSCMLMLIPEILVVPLRHFGSSHLLEHLLRGDACLRPARRHDLTPIHDIDDLSPPNTAWPRVIAESEDIDAGDASSCKVAGPGLAGQDNHIRG